MDDFILRIISAKLWSHQKTSGERNRQEKWGSSGETEERDADCNGEGPLEGGGYLANVTIADTGPTADPRPTGGLMTYSKNSSQTHNIWLGSQMA